MARVKTIAAPGDQITLVGRFFDPVAARNEIRVGGVLLERFGLVPSVVAMTFVGALAEPSPRWLRVAAISVLLVGFAWLVFVAGLDLRLPLVKF